MRPAGTNSFAAAFADMFDWGVVAGAAQVSAAGDIANWMIPGKMVGTQPLPMGRPVDGYCWLAGGGWLN